jgi:uncharacterized protein (TIGR02246 family)
MQTIRFGILLSLLAGCACSLLLFGQNIPIMIWDQVEKPKVKVPNPMDQAGQPSHTSNSNQYAGQPDAEVRANVDNVITGFSERNLAKTLRSYWQGPELVVFWGSRELRGGDAFAKYLQVLWTSSENPKITLDPPGIRVFGRFAWLTAAYRWETSTGADHVTRPGRTTWILEKRYNQWMIIHQHFSLMNPE